MVLGENGLKWWKSVLVPSGNVREFEPSHVANFWRIIAALAEDASRWIA